MSEQTKHELEQLKLLVIVTFGSFLTFAVFVLTLVGARWLTSTWPEVGILIIVKMVAWILTVFSAICCISAVVVSTIRFLRFLFKSLRKENRAKSNN